MTNRLSFLYSKYFWTLLFFFVMFIYPAFADGEDEEDFKVFCPTIDEYEAEGRTFLLKSAFETIAKVCSKVATQSWGAFAPPLQGVIAIAISIYIALATLKNVGSFSQQDVSAYLSGEKGGVIPLGVKAAWFIFLLGNSAFVYQYLVTPIIVAGAEIGGSRLGSFGGASSVSALFSKVISIAEDYNGRTYRIVAMGRLFLCLVTLPESMLDWYFGFFFFGAVLCIFGWIVIIGLSFYLLDLLFRLGVGCMMLPMGIACGVSKLSSSYTVNVWNLFVNVAYNFVILGIIIDFSTAMIMSSVSAGNSTGLAQKLAKELHKPDVDEIYENITLAGFILMCVSCVVALKLFMDVENITEKVSGAAGVGKKNGAGAVAAAASKKIADHGIKKPLAEVGQMAKAAGQEGLQDIKNTKAVSGAIKAGNRFKKKAWRGAKNAVKTFVGLPRD